MRRFNPVAHCTCTVVTILQCSRKFILWLAGNRDCCLYVRIGWRQQYQHKWNNINITFNSSNSNGNNKNSTSTLTMIDSLTIFSKGGTILYHYTQPSSSPSMSKSSTSISNATTTILNHFIDTVLLENRYKSSNSNNVCTLRCSPPPSSVLHGSLGSSASASAGGTKVIAEWEESGGGNASKRSNAKNKNPTLSIEGEWVAVVLYQEVLKNRFHYVRDLLKSTLQEYTLFHESVVVVGTTRPSDIPHHHHKQEGQKYDLNDGVDTFQQQQQQLVLLGPHIPSCNPSLFDPTFITLLRQAEKSSRLEYHTTTNTIINNGGKTSSSSNSSNSSDDSEQEVEDNVSTGSSIKETEDQENKDIVLLDGKAVAMARLKASRKHRTTTTTTSSKNKTQQSRKKDTVWHDGSGKVTKAALQTLDKSKKTKNQQHASLLTTNTGNDDDDDARALAEARAAYLPSSNNGPNNNDNDEEDLFNDDDLNFGTIAIANSNGNNGSNNNSSNGWWFRRIFNQLSGNKILSEEDVTPMLNDMQTILLSKNVAHDIALEICDSVKTRLVGKRLQSFSRIKTMVRMSLEASISRILTPYRDVDVLRDVVAKRESVKRPYVIVMIGINGVGKSTSLAKIAYYLKSNGCHPLIAACDTFRSGAVEQLNVHAKCLDVPLFQRGYAKDPSSVALAAISQAGSDGHDVVLVDTAGRMQNNVPLMRALSKLVVESRPDLVLFVGEALVGNDGIDQLKMFDQALQTGGHDRSIDGIVLTKFDTVSDKVGAALTMTRISGQPVVFVGTGQKYNHLKKLSPSSVIKSLFS